MPRGATVIRTNHDVIVMVGDDKEMWLTIVQWHEPDHDDMFEEWCCLIYQAHITEDQIQDGY